MRLVDVLPKIAEWQAIPYSIDLMCYECGKTGFCGRECRKPNLVGWCETNYGYQAVFECTECGSKFRFHGGDPISTLVENEEQLREITDEDINNAWYVKALKEMSNAN